MPWNDVVSELRSVQQSCRQLKTQVEGSASNLDTNRIVASQEALSRRISMIEDGVQYDRNIRMQARERATETHREYQTKVDLCLAQIERLTNRMRTHDWYRELSEQESEDGSDQMVRDEPRGVPPQCGIQRIRVPTAEVERWINQIREEFRNTAVDGSTLTRRFTQFVEERQRREENSRALLELRHVRKHCQSLPCPSSVFAKSCSAEELDLSNFVDL